jgi:hypothetical protein
MQLQHLYFPSIKNKWLLIVPALCVFLIAAAFILKKPSSISQGNEWRKSSPSPALSKAITETFQPAIDSKKLTREFIVDNTFAATVGGFIVFKYNFSAACAYNGCTHTVTDNYSTTKHLSLWGNPIFSPGKNARSIVIQQSVDQKPVKHEIDL